MTKWLTAVVMTGWVVLTAGRAQEWRGPDDMVIWATAVEHSPTRTRPQFNFAVALARRGYFVNSNRTFLEIATRVGELDEAKTEAEANYRRSRLTPKDFDAWFRGDSLALIIPPSSRGYDPLPPERQTATGLPAN